MTKLTILIFSLSLLLLTGCGDKEEQNTPKIEFDMGEEVEDVDWSKIPLKDINCSKFPEKPSEFLTQEYCLSANSLGMIKASAAYRAGATGKGILVAVLDSGYQFNQPDLQDNIHPDSISLVGRIYDPINGEAWADYMVRDLDGAKSDELEKIQLYGGSYRGENYITAPKIIIEGDGFGAEAIAILDKDENGTNTGEVYYVLVVNGGSGYTYMNITVDDNGTGGSGLKIWDYLLGGEDNQVTNFGHATIVGTILAGKKHQHGLDDTFSEADTLNMQGVAYDAQILNIRVVTQTGLGYQTERGIDYAYAHGAQIVNVSLGSYNNRLTSPAFLVDTTPIKDRLLRALQADMTFVFGAGNDASTCSNFAEDRNESTEEEHRCFFPASYAFLPEGSELLTQDGGWIVAGSIKEDGVTMSDFSNRAGLSKSHYLVTQADNVTACLLPYNHNPIGGIDQYRGTSFSAPQISGAVALLKEKYPQFKGNEIAQILFDSATDLGEVGCDDVYGHGLLNIESAFELAEQRANSNSTQP